MSKEKEKEEKKNEEKDEIVEVTGGELVVDSDTHDINISEEVVATIAGLAAQEVKGVASLNASGISEVFGMKTKGVKVQNGEKDTVIDISLTVEYGSRIPDIAWEVQNRVKTQVESMTGLNVVAVNVHVQGVVMPKKKGEKQEPRIEAASEVEAVDYIEEGNKEE